MENYSCNNPFAHLSLPSTFHPAVFAAICGDPKARWSDTDFPLKVQFLNQADLGRKFSWYYEGKLITIDKLIKWSNKWCSSSKRISVFKLKKASEVADIRILFHADKPSECKVGAYAKEVDSPYPTMWLNLSTKFAPGDDSKKHTVIHEFGHALGLLHEHERPDLWNSIGPFLDRAEIQKYHYGDGAGDDGHNLDNHMAGDPDAKDGHYFSPITEYDRSSIMHYPWCANGLLKKGYDTVDKVKEKCRNGEVTKDQCTYLIEVITGPNGVFITTPSEKDREGLKKAYNLKCAILVPVLFCLDSGVLLSDDCESPHDMDYPGHVYGSFYNWEREINMLDYQFGKPTTVNHPVGKHQHKFFVDGKWCYYSNMGYMDVFQGEEVPNPMTVLQATTEVNNLAAQVTAFDSYNKGMDNLCGADRPYLSTEMLKSKHQEFLEASLNDFRSKRKMGSSQISQTYEDELIRKIEEACESFLKRNESKRIWFACRTPAVLFTVMVISYLMSSILDMLGVASLSQTAILGLYVPLILTYIWLYVKYSGKYREIGEFIDNITSSIWDEVVQPIYAKLMEKALT